MRLSTERGTVFPRLDRWLPWGLGALALLVYVPALGGGFLFDDHHLVVENAFLREPRTLWRFFLHPLTSTQVAGDMYRPLTTATLMLNYACSGLRPFGYHLLNLLLHVVNGLLVWRLLRLLLPERSTWAAAFGAALFLLHPVHSNAVAYVTSRSTLLAACGVLGSLVAYRISRSAPRARTPWRLLSLAAFTGALLSKETGIVLPGLLVLADLTVWSHRLPGQPKAGWCSRNGLPVGDLRQVAGWMPFLALSAGYLLWRWLSLGTIGPMVTARPGWFNLGTACQAVWRYLQLFLAPDGLCLTRGVAVPTRMDDPVAMGAMAGYVALMALVVWWLHRRPLWACALGWFLVALFPSHPMGSLHLTAADHHLYLPSVGLVLASAALVDEGRRRWRRLTSVAVVIVLALCGLSTWQRSWLWRDEVGVWESTVRQAPQSAIAWSNLGLAHEARGRLDAAEHAFLQALRLHSGDYALVIGNLGRLMALRGDPATALPLLRLANTYQPEAPFLLSALGFSLSRLGRYDEAEVMYRRAIARNPATAEAYNNWGVDQARRGHPEAAIATFHRGLAWGVGGTDLRRHLGHTLAAQGRSVEAAVEYAQMARAPEGTVADWQQAAVLYEAAGRYAEAVAVAQAMVRLYPDDGAAHYRLGRLYGRLGRPEALRALQRATRLSPTLAEAQYDLAVTYTALEPPRLELARYHLREAQRLGWTIPDAFLRRLRTLDAAAVSGKTPHP